MAIELRNGGIAECRNCGMGKMAGMVVMADGMVEWRGRNGRMAEMATYVLFTVHTNDDTDTDTNNNLIFYSIEKKI